jgi:hypothetical protein
MEALIYYSTQLGAAVSSTSSGCWQQLPNGSSAILEVLEGPRMQITNRTDISNVAVHGSPVEMIHSLVRFEDFTAVTMEIGLFWMLRYVALVRMDVSEEVVPHSSG